jgi:translation initiation factor IF-3
LIGEVPIKQERARINTEIRAPQVRVIDEDGAQLGVLTVKEAIAAATAKALDLIEIVPTAEPPVCKIMDFGKYKYELAKKDKLQKKHQHVTLVKEIRFHPNTDTHDFDFKVRHARAFIDEGHKVKATVVFKGREITYQDQGRAMLDHFTEQLEDIARIDAPAKMEGRQMIAYYVADKTKKKTSESSKPTTEPS